MQDDDFIVATPCNALSLFFDYVGLRGTIGGYAVLRVLRRGPQAVHSTSQPLEEGSEVHVKVDWRRRFDHMQQHSG